jgi:hypothetical protein
MLKEGKNLNNNYLVFRDANITIDKRKRRLPEVDTKEIYWHILKFIAERPTSEKKWHEKTYLDLNDEEWATIYTLNNDVTRDNSMLNLQFKITHRIMACGYNLNVWKIKSSNVCEVCNDYVDTIEHFMIQCRKTNIFWNQILNWWENNMKVIFRLDTYEILFGIPNDEKDRIIHQFNFILMMARSYIYKCKKAGNAMDTYEFLLGCKNHLQLEEIIMAANNKAEKFIQIWQDLYQNI